MANTVILKNNPGLFTYDLTINGVTPQVPVEETPVEIIYTLLNRTSTTASGWISSNWNGNDQSVTVPAGQSYRGSITRIAPSAGSDQLRLWYTQPQFGVEFPSPLA